MTFHFELVHVKGTHHGPDGLSRRPHQPDNDSDDIDEEEDEEFEDWIDRLHGFLHVINDVENYSFAKPTASPIILILATAQISSEEEGDDSYNTIPRSENAKSDDIKLLAVRKWHQDWKRPLGMTDKEYATFLRYATEFFPDQDRLWRKDAQGAHKLVLHPERRLEVLRQVHDNIGHKHFYTTRATLLLRFWWPHMHSDLVWFVRTCHICQIQQTTKVLIPPTVATPAPLFSKIYIDTMHMPASGGFKYFVQGRCSLCHFPEFCMLHEENAVALVNWIYQDIICRWGALGEIVTNNMKVFIAALLYLLKCYHINYIRISGYNLRANGIIERSHFDVRQALFKAVDGEESKWSRGAYSVIWAERITVRKRMGCSPYYATTGTHPLIPLDITEATYLQPPPNSILSTTDLIARRAIALQKCDQDLSTLHRKVYRARLRAAILFECKYARTIKNFNFKKGNLVLMRNTQIEYALNRKMKPRYLGPLIVISRNKGGAYIVCELDGSVLHRPIAAFQLLPYLARKLIVLPDGFIDIDTKRLRQLEDMELPDELAYNEISEAEDGLNRNDEVGTDDDPDTNEEA